MGNVQEERQEWRRPEDVTRFAGINYDVGYMLLDESPSDLAGQVVAAITAGAIALQQYEVIDRSIAKNMVRLPQALPSRHRPECSVVLAAHGRHFGGACAPLVCGLLHTRPSDALARCPVARRGHEPRTRS